MFLAPEQLQALRDCCKDEAAFVRLQQLLAEILPHPPAEAAPSHPREAWYQAILQAMPDRMFRVNRCGEYLDFKGIDDDAAIGVQAEAIVGKTIHYFLPAPIADACLSLIDKALETRTLQTYEYQLASPWEGQYDTARDYEARLIACGKDEVLILVRDITAYKQSDSKLRRSEKLYRTLAHNFPNGAVFLFNHDLRYVVAEGSGLAILGYSREALEGKTIWEALPSATCALIEPIYRAALTGNVTVEEVAHHDRIYLWHVLPVRNIQGEIFAGMVMTQDITERKQAEEALREKEARYRSLYNNTPVMLHSIDPEGRLISVSDFWLLKLGYARHEVIGRKSVEFITEASRRYAEAAILPDFFRTGVCQDVPYVFVKKNGETIDVLLSAIAEKDANGQITRSLAVLTDVTQRKQTEAALRENEERFRSLVEQSLVGIYVIQHGKFKYVNPKFAEIIGCTPEEVYPFPVIEWVVPEDRAQVKENIRKRMEGEIDSLHYGLRVRHKHGDIVEVEVLGSRTEFNGEPALIGTLIDVTERKQAELALKESEEKFSKAFSSSPSPILIIRFADSKIIDVNDSFLKSSGYSRAEVVDRKIDDLGLFINPIIREQIRQLLWQQGSVHDLEFEFRKKSGEIGIGLFSAEVIHLGQELCTLAVPRDITELKRAEAQLRAAAERERLLGQSSLRIRRSLNLDQILTTTVAEVRQVLQVDRVFIGQIDETGQGRIMAESVEPGWQSILAWITDDIYLCEVQMLFDQGRRQAIDDTDQATLSPELVEYYAMCQIQASLGVPIMVNNKFFGALIANHCASSRHWQSFEIELLEQLANQVSIAVQQAELYQQVQTFASSQEQKVQERTAQLQQKMQELQELSQVKEDFLHAVSHDLRTPVMGLALVLQNLHKKTSESVTISKSMLERMMQSIDRQLMMINSLLEAHSSEVSGVVLKHEQVQLTQLISTIVADLEPLMAQNQATFKNLLPANLPVLIADPAQLRRVFENLITNALKHNPPGLVVTLQVNVEKDKLRCLVQDNGIGMNAAECESLFDRYARGSRARRSAGLGLGLYLCRQIINAHSGEIGVISSPQAGATFWFTLPCAVAAAER
ncbi:MAG: PAS domain S-box protein [Scytolyngbya sp. HA4215-MV1]|jgi:PAS domain S-box-containing protein|nr:PAS domain S-box protein [Scytolyngbya sp. HA4215-MV1]